MLLQIVELVDHALQVTAEEVAVVVAGHAAIFGLFVPGGMQRGRDVAVEDAAVGRGVVAGVAVAEAVGEDLVDDGVLAARQAW